MNEIDQKARAKALEAENSALRLALALMHRRAQKNEGAAARLERVRRGYAKDLRETIDMVRHWRDAALRHEREIRGLKACLAAIPGWLKALFG